MKLLDKYILKKFLSTFFFVVLILLAVITVIDLTDKMDKFAKAGVTAGQIAGYYLDYISWIGSFITPITIFIATVYVCSQMAVRTEIIAILSSGVSFKRMLVPYFIGAFIVAVISFVLNGWIIPNATKSRLAFEVEFLKGKFYYDKRNIHIQVAPDTYLYLQSYNNTSNTGYHFSLEKFDNNRLVEKLTANRIEWDTTKQKWTLRDYKIKRVDHVFEAAAFKWRNESDSTLTDSTGFTTPTDSVSLLNDSAKADSTHTPSQLLLAGKNIITGDKIDTALVIHPREFENDYRKYEGMTLGELNRYIRTLKERGSTGIEVFEVEKFTRYSSPFSVFVLVFMGVIVSSRKSRGGTGLQIALGFVLSFVFILFFVLFRTFAEAGSLPPAISVWIPNIIFIIISLFMYKYVPR